MQLDTYAAPEHDIQDKQERRDESIRRRQILCDYLRDAGDAVPSHQIAKDLGWSRDLPAEVAAAWPRYLTSWVEYSRREGRSKRTTYIDLHCIDRLPRVV